MPTSDTCDKCGTSLVSHQTTSLRFRFAILALVLLVGIMLGNKELTTLGALCLALERIGIALKYVINIGRLLCIVAFFPFGCHAIVILIDLEIHCFKGHHSLHRLREFKQAAVDKYLESKLNSQDENGPGELRPDGTYLAEENDNKESSNSSQPQDSEPRLFDRFLPRNRFRFKSIHFIMAMDLAVAVILTKYRERIDLALHNALHTAFWRLCYLLLDPTFATFGGLYLLYWIFCEASHKTTTSETAHPSPRAHTPDKTQKTKHSMHTHGDPSPPCSNPKQTDKEKHSVPISHRAEDLVPERAVKIKPFTQIKNNTFLHNVPVKTTFQVLIDMLRMRQEDEWVFGGTALTGSIYNIEETTSEKAFRTFIAKAAAIPGFLPPWWTAATVEVCINFSRFIEESSLSARVTKLEIQESWNNREMPMKLRMMGEKVYGDFPFPNHGDVLGMMVARENGDGRKHYVSIG